VPYFLLASCVSHDLDSPDFASVYYKWYKSLLHLSISKILIILLINEHYSWHSYEMAVFIRSYDSYSCLHKSMRPSYFAITAFPPYVTRKHCESPSKIRHWPIGLHRQASASSPDMRTEIFAPACCRVAEVVVCWLHPWITLMFSA
jgi:hypothetical protein